MNKTHIAAALAAFALSGSLMAQTLVTVNGTKIDSSEIERRAKVVQKQSQGQVQDGPQLRQLLAQEIVVETAVAQEAKRLGLNKSSEYQAAFNAIKAQSKGKQADYKQNLTAYDNQLLGRMFANHVIAVNPITDTDVQNRYEQIKNRYQGTDEVQISEIVTKSAQDAQAAINELNSKKKFADVAQKYSIDPEVKAGNVLSSAYLPLVDLKESRVKIYDAVANLQAGQFTKQALTGDNVSVVFYVNDRRPINMQFTDAMRSDIENTLKIERINTAVEGVLRKANIVPAKSTEKK